MDKVEETPCLKCGKKTLIIEMRLTTKPMGTYSIAGVQPKVMASEWPWLKCINCGIESAAKE